MNIKFRLTSSGFAAAALAAGLNLLNAVTPVELLSLPQGGQTASRQAWAQDAEEAVNVRVYQAASPAVVSIDTRDGSGSGSIISPDGLILTNAHVVSGSQTVRVTLADGRKFDAEVIAFGEAGLDLAAVKIQGQTDLPTLQLAPPGSVAVGQRAFAIGNPFGQFQGTFTTGIVSRIDSNRGLIQTDTAINPGNSGGPLLNSRGELIGVNSAIFSPRGAAGNIGIGFAIAVDRVQTFLAAVRDGTAPRVAQQSPILGGGQRAERVTLNGAPIQGRLDDTSGVLPADNSYFNAYTFEGRAGQQVVIEMSSTEFDAYLILLAPDGRDLAQDDDSGGGSNARLQASLPVDGIYTVLANTYQSGETGNYNLRLATGAVPSPISPPTSRMRPRSPRPQQPQQQSANPRLIDPSAPMLLQEQGTLGPESSVMPSDGSLYQEHRFQGNVGQSVTISLESDDFDTYLIVLDVNGRPIAENNNIAPNNTNSAVTITLPQSGTYRIIANAFDRTGRGTYRLMVQ